MTVKHQTITSLRWGTVPYAAGSGLHIGCGGLQRTFPNAVGIDTQIGPGVDLVMKLDRFPLFAAGAFDFVVLGDALRRVAQPQVLLADAWRILGEGGMLILPQPTPRAREWILGADSAYRDLVEHPPLHLGALQVDIFQKLPAGEGRHCVPAIENEKTVAVIRPGGFGDALWAASILPALKREGYHVTVYTEEPGEQILRHDPHVDQLLVHDELRTPNENLGAYWAHEHPRYDRWINLTEVVEKNLIAVPNDLRFFWTDEERRRVFNRSYIEAVHDLAGVPRKYAPRFYATEDERAWAAQKRGDARKVAVVAASGSTLPKFWPYLDALAAGLIARGYDVWILGDLRERAVAPRAGLQVIGTDWSMREALAFSLQADVVIGQETAITNAVALEPMRKVVLLSHSTARNLTHYWANALALHGDAPCWPCHRIHYMKSNWAHCNRDEKTGTAKCQSTIGADQVLAAVDRPFVVRAAA